MNQFENKIFHGDCLELMKNLPDNSVDFVLCDLPYNLTDCKYDKKIFNLEKFWEQVKRILKSKCSVALFASSRFSFKLYNSNPEWYKYKWIWEKNMPVFFVHAKNAPMRIFEEILIFSNGIIQHSNLTDNRMKYFPQGVKQLEKPRLQHRKKDTEGVYNHGTILNPYKTTQTNYPVDVLKIDMPFNVGRHHPNEKPIDLLEYLIKTYTNEGEIVLDATIGSGSTAVAAINTNRKFIGY